MAIGDIGAAVIDDLSIWPDGTVYSPPVEVGDGVYAAAFTGGGNDGYVRTFSVDAVGNIAAIHSFEFDPVNGGSPILSRIGSTNVYMIAYTGPGAAGVTVITLSISAAGTIGGILDTLILEAAGSYARAPEILHISGNVYAYAYQGPNISRPRVRTFDCTDAGTLGALIQLKEWDITQNKAIEFKHIAGNVYFVASTQAINNSTMRTFIINNDGTFGANIGSWDFDTPGAGTAVRLLKVGAGIYAICWYSATGKGLATFAMTDAGVITVGFIDFVAHGPDIFDIIKISDGMVALAYRQTVTNIAKVETWEIDTSGNIDAAEHDHLDYSADYSARNYLFRRGGSIWGSVVTGPPTLDLWVKTFQIITGGGNRAYVIG